GEFLKKRQKYREQDDIAAHFHDRFEAVHHTGIQDGKIETSLFFFQGRRRIRKSTPAFQIIFSESKAEKDRGADQNGQSRKHQTFISKRFPYDKINDKYRACIVAE